MKRFVFLLFSAFFLAFPSAVHAQEYEIISFQSRIVIEKDTSISVTETIHANFLIPKHGIFRFIPERALQVISVTNEAGIKYPYEVTGGQTKNIKIGDPDITTTGSHTYIISYKIPKFIKRFDAHDEFYWNITGHEWDVPIEKASASVESTFAQIIKVDCFAGAVGTQEKFCTQSFSSNEASFSGTKAIEVGEDFTLVLGLNKANSLEFPSGLENFLDFLLSNWGYLFTPWTLLIPLYFWFKKGRDNRFISDAYYIPDNKAQRTVSLFERKHLPLVYSPIQGMTPAQLGTVLDEKVDIQDVVAEIVELARLGFLKITKLKEKGILRKSADYEFEKTPNKDTSKLEDYQKYLLDSIFESEEKILLSELKNKFYLKLPEFKNLLYQNVSEVKFFDGDPEKVRGKWLGILIAIGIVSFLILQGYAAASSNPIPLFVLFGFSAIGFIFAHAMPRRTPVGYQKFRQAEGLRWYLDKGKWRHEIAEKHLFLEEILPLAISLGVVKKLTKDMSELGIDPPSYIHGTSAHSFASDFGSFQAHATSSLASAPGGSGGSGFGGGGSSGGGGGGGGGGSW